mmetsp:Transcript_34773/g.68419  ORF Transcript_34773/g.68419 Transcript_34773/m.68419 type:complete len:87 (+) Transcript_34773:880-1140(+)
MLFVLPPTRPTVRHPPALSFTSKVAAGSMEEGEENISLADVAVPDVARHEIVSGWDASLLATANELTVEMLNENTVKSESMGDMFD